MGEGADVGVAAWEGVVELEGDAATGDREPELQPAASINSRSAAMGGLDLIQRQRMLGKVRR